LVKLSELDIFVLLILDHEKACTTKRLAKIIDKMQSQRYLCNVLARLNRIGLVKSMRCHTFRFINPNYSLTENATSLKEKIHQLQKS
jgi:DNA-binding HxlR family transcriptional regulator